MFTLFCQGKQTNKQTKRQLNYRNLCPGQQHRGWLRCEGFAKNLLPWAWSCVAVLAPAVSRQGVLRGARGPAPFALGNRGVWGSGGGPGAAKMGWGRQGHDPTSPQPQPVCGEGGEDLVNNFATEFLFLFFFFFLKKKTNQPTTPKSFESSFDFSKDRV